MDADELERIGDGLRWVSDRLRKSPQVGRNGLAAAAACTMARMVVVEMASGLKLGANSDEALAGAASGGFTLLSQQADLLRMLADRLDAGERPGG